MSAFDPRAISPRTATAELYPKMSDLCLTDCDRSYDGEWSFLLDSNLEQYYLKGYKLLSYNHVGLDNGANTEQAIPKN